MLKTLLGFLLVASFVHAHPGESHIQLSPAEFSRRQLEANERHVKARSCAPEFAAYNAMRKAKRASRKRQHSTTTTSTTPTDTSTSPIPSATALQNTTCITAPEVTEGPYYISNELVRTDLRESQSGISLYLDIGVMDTTTCQPLPDVFVELWNCNATGFYAGFTTASLGGGGGGGGAPNATSNTTFTGSDTITSTASMSMGSFSSMPSMSVPSNMTGGGAAPSTSMTDEFTWLRGGEPTNSEGLVHLITIYPGFYEGRTVHVHVMIHQNYSVASNGTIVSHDGSVRHIGQLFFEEGWNDMVLNSTAYLNNTNTRTLNSEDSIFGEEDSDGYGAFIDLQLIGQTIEDGVYGYITIGVNTSFTSSITSTNYYNPTTLLSNSSTSSTPSNGSTSSARRNEVLGWVPLWMMG